VTARDGERLLLHALPHINAMFAQTSTAPGRVQPS
jgi:hypothetical protein